MNLKNGLIVASVAIACAVAVSQLRSTASPAAPITGTDEIDAFIKLHQDARRVLRNSFAERHDLVAPEDHSQGSNDFNWPKVNREHLKQLLVNGQYDGQFTQHYLITYSVQDDANANNTGRTDSQSMEATAPLNHYLSPLEKLGLACRDSPMAAVGRTQYAAKTWVPKERYENEQSTDSPIWVEGQVFYAPKDRAITLRVTIGGRFVPRRD